jgi:hypothetical protein
MYVAKFDREGILWRVTLLEKEWSQEMLSHEIKEISSKRFLFSTRAYRWIHNQIIIDLFAHRKLEIING